LKAFCLAVAVVCSTGCRKREVPVDAMPTGPTATIDFDAELLYVDTSGQVRLARGVAAVPVASRRAVAIEGPDGPGGAVWIGDVSIPSPAGWTGWRGHRRDLERRGLAALPPGPGSRLTFPAPAGTPPAPEGVVVYGTSWCAVCADARAWLDGRGVAYTAYDVERDPAAALAVADTLDALGVVADRVPVIDVAGRVLVGFDPTRLATILGEPI
jgi:glutaredoxin